MQERQELSFCGRKILFDKNNYAISLVRVPSTTQQHAHIIVEGLKENGELIRKFAHYVIANFDSDYGQVKGFKNVPDNYMHYKAKTWIVPKENALAMMKAINDKDGDYAFFSILGRYSIFNEGEVKDNCCTWAIEQLKIAGIDAKPTDLSNNLITATSSIIEPSSTLTAAIKKINQATSTLYEFFNPAPAVSPKEKEQEEINDFVIINNHTNPMG